MSKKTTEYIDLLKANRKETLTRAALTRIQPRGKFHGFDVFTWLDAPEEVLLSTFNSMPYPIHWVSTLNYFNVVVNSVHVQLPNVQQVYLLDDLNNTNLINLQYQVFDGITSVLKQPSLINGKGILILTGLGSEGIDAINELALILKTIHGL
jgi:hypothetical protein